MRGISRVQYTGVRGPHGPIKRWESEMTPSVTKHEDLQSVVIPNRRWVGTMARSPRQGGSHLNAPGLTLCFHSLSTALAWDSVGRPVEIGSPELCQSEPTDRVGQQSVVTSDRRWAGMRVRSRCQPVVLETRTIFGVPTALMVRLAVILAREWGDQT